VGGSQSRPLILP